MIMTFTILAPEVIYSGSAAFIQVGLSFGGTTYLIKTLQWRLTDWKSGTLLQDWTTGDASSGSIDVPGSALVMLDQHAERETKRLTVKTTHGNGVTTNSTYDFTILSLVK